MQNYVFLGNKKHPWEGEQIDCNMILFFDFKQSFLKFDYYLVIWFVYFNIYAPRAFWVFDSTR